METSLVTLLRKVLKLKPNDSEYDKQVQNLMENHFWSSTWDSKQLVKLMVTLKTVSKILALVEPSVSERFQEYRGIFTLAKKTDVAMEAVTSSNKTDDKVWLLKSFHQYDISIEDQIPDDADHVFIDLYITADLPEKALSLTWKLLQKSSIEYTFETIVNTWQCAKASCVKSVLQAKRLKHPWEMILRTNTAVNKHTETYALLKQYGPATAFYLWANHSQPHNPMLWQKSFAYQKAIRDMIQKQRLVIDKTIPRAKTSNGYTKGFLNKGNGNKKRNGKRNGKGKK